MQFYERLDSLVRWLLIGLLGLVPFIFVPIAWIGVIQSKVMLIAVVLFFAALFWTLARLLEGSAWIPWSGVLAAATLIPLAYTISICINGFEQLSIIGSGTDADTLAGALIAFSILVLYATVFAGRSGTIVSALRAFIAGTIVLMALEVVHFALPSASLGGVFASLSANPFGTWNQLAMFAGLMLFSSVALLYSAIARGPWRYALYACALFSTALLVVANFFDVWASVSVALVVFLLIRAYKVGDAFSESFWRAHMVPIAAAIIALFFLVFGTFVSNVLPEQIRPANVDVRPSWVGTLSVGKQSLASPLALLFGSGPNTFTREWGLHKPVQVNQTPFWNTDFNAGVASIPTSFITSGLAGVIAWILLILVALFSIARLWLSQSHSVSDALSVAAIYLLALHALSVPGIVLGIITSIVLGLLIASVTPQFFPLRECVLGRSVRGSVQMIGVLLFGALAVLAAGGTVLVLATDIQVNRGILMYNATRDAARASAMITRAISIYPTDRAHRAAVELGLLQLRDLGNANNPDQEAARARLQSTLEQTIQHGLSAVSIDGGAYQNWLGLAALYAELAGANVEGAYDNARAAYERALAENPTSPLPLLNLARLELLQNKPDQALIQLDKAVQLKPDFAAAYYLASQAYAAQNDLQNAMRAAAKAVENAQADAQAWYNFGLIAYTANEYQQAATALEQALTRQEKFANAMYILGLSYYELKRPEDATKMFEALLQLDPDQASVKQVLENLRSGRPPITPAAATSTPVQPR